MDTQSKQLLYQEGGLSIMSTVKSEKMTIFVKIQGKLLAKNFYTVLTNVNFDEVKNILKESTKFKVNQSQKTLTLITLNPLNNKSIQTDFNLIESKASFGIEFIESVILRCEQKSPMKDEEVKDIIQNFAFGLKEFITYFQEQNAITVDKLNQQKNEELVTNEKVDSVYQKSQIIKSEVKQIKAKNQNLASIQFVLAQNLTLKKQLQQTLLNQTKAISRQMEQFQNRLLILNEQFSEKTNQIAAKFLVSTSNSIIKQAIKAPENNSKLLPNPTIDFSKKWASQETKDATFSGTNIIAKKKVLVKSKKIIPKADKFSFSIKVLKKQQNILIGIMQKSINAVDQNLMNIMYADCNGLVALSFQRQMGSTLIQINHTVDVNVDLKNCKIEWYTNKKIIYSFNWKMMQLNFENVEWVPFVEMSNKGDQVCIIN